MVFFVVLCLVIVSGGGAGTEPETCAIPEPECLYGSPFDEDVLNEHRESGDFLPSNEFLVKTCNHTLEYMKCVGDYYTECPYGSIDVNAGADILIEFCDEGSDLRKDYLKHLHCLKSVNITNACEISFAKVKDIPIHVDQTLTAKNIQEQCLPLHIVKPCIVGTIEESCGEEAAQTSGTFSRRIENVFSCSENNTQYFDEILRNLTLETNSVVF